MSGWTRGEIAVVVDAVRRAPFVHNRKPWVLEFHDHDACLFERFDVRLPHHDPTRRDRLISCGAALASLRLAVRSLGWGLTWTQFPDPVRPDEVARVSVAGRSAPTDSELALYQAIPDRHSHRTRFGPDPVPELMMGALAHTMVVPGVLARSVHGIVEATALAEVLGYAAGVLRGDRGYQRELLAWTGRDGVAEASLPDGALPWAGLIRTGTRIPDRETLAARLAAESQLVVVTPGDGRRDHLLAGAALQEIWLVATQAGLAASLVTQPLHLREVRAGLIEQLDLAGVPQALLRVGYPAGAAPSRKLVRDPIEEATP